MVNKKQQSITIDLDPAVADEFQRIAQSVGFKDSEAILKNYVREVIISARLENATAQLRQTVVRGSSDLDSLVPAQAKQAKQ